VDSVRRVVPQETRLSRVLISNVYLVDAGAAGRWLVDTGHRLERRALLRELGRAGCAPAALAGVLLTHRHSDHAGNAAFLRHRFGVKLFAHRADAEVLEGTLARPRLVRGGEAFIEATLGRIENRYPSAPTKVDRHLDGGEDVAGFEVHWTPGHTGGSMLLRRPDSRSLFSGDMVLNAAPPLVLRAGLHGPYADFSEDMPQAHEALRAFQRRGLAYDHLLAGHGPPLLGGARAKVDALLERL
jgi:glyoxylase-like metal-dependent hydrolase (beta-lactamase superfamily II)